MTVCEKIAIGDRERDLNQIFLSLETVELSKGALDIKSWQEQRWYVDTRYLKERKA